MNAERPIAPDPYAHLDPAPSFLLESDDLIDGGEVPVAQRRAGAGGGDQSPHLRWSGFPEETKSFAVTCFDPDAPTVSGFWHWLVGGIDGDVVELPRGAGTGDEALPKGALHMRNDFGDLNYAGAAPPAGDRAHRYMFVVHALSDSVEDIEFESSDTPAAASFNMLAAELARATLTVTYQR
ncbi:MAG TPA: YbhB/YbcL family Raf kinase inhibitor-like protein [Micromonosporaceae bacterium]|jgi:hypothetical protein